MKTSVSFFAFLLMLACSSAGQSLRGRVLDASTLAPLPGAAVSLLPSGLVATADASGNFEVPEPQPWTSLQVQAGGFEPVVIRRESLPGGFLTIPLRPLGFVLDSVWIVAGESRQLLRNQAASVTLIRKEELLRDDQMSIQPALQRVPGVQMQQGALNTSRISIRGIGARTPFGTTKIRAYFEDIPLTDGEGGSSLEDLDLSFIEKVEVIRGPASSMYGAGLAGTIRLSALQPGWTGSRAEAGWQMGSFGTSRATLSAQVADDGVNLQVLGQRTHSDGFRANSVYDRQGLFARATWLAGQKSTLSWLGQWTDVQAFIPSSIDSLAFRTDPSQAAFTWAKTRGNEAYQRAYSGLSWRYQYNPNWEHWVSVFGGSREADEIRPFDILREQQAMRGLRARWFGRFEEWRLTFGTELFREHYDWSTYQNIAGLGDRGASLSDNQETRRYGNAFAQADGDFSTAWHWELGANVNMTRYEYEDFFQPDSLNRSGEYGFPAIFSPRAALLWVQPGWTARVQLSHGFSPPSLAETLTPEGRINPDIRPEQGWNLEAGWRGYLLPGRIWVDATAYRMWVNNLLVAQRVGNDQYVGVNAGKTLHDGVELALNFQAWKTLRFWANFTGQWHRFVEFQDRDQDFAGKALAGVPAQQASAGFDFDLPAGLMLRVQSQWVSRIPLRDDNSVYSDSYGLLHARLDYQTSWKRLNATVYAGANNLLDAKYASMVLVNAGSFGGNRPRYYYPGAPRGFYAGLSLALR